jgi:hypothetical protein
MRTTKGIPWRVSLSGAVAGALLVLLATGAQAQTGTCADVDSCKIGSDRAASLVLFPKIVVDTSNGLDTVIQLTNAGERRTIGAHCFYIDASHCSNSGTFCRASSECPTGETCDANWQQTDFTLRLTKRQPLSWNASQRTPFLPCDAASPTATSCIRDSEGHLIFNTGNIPPVQSDPFIGELKCVQIDDETEEPVDFNEMIGNATFIRGRSRLSTDISGVDAAKYNAIGIQAIPNRNDGNSTLCLGGDDPTNDCPNAAEYASCPSVLIMNHFFDGAHLEGEESVVQSSLTLVPCAEDIANGSIVGGVGNLPLTTVQFLVYNEFEQRFSTSFRFRCFDDRILSDIDTRFGPADDGASIFNIGVQGTIAGQSRIRSVGTSTEARGILGMLTETVACSTGPGHECTDASNLHFQGKRSLPDLIQLP